ncbi:Hypothetical protein R9X50_00360000 [Acrodontium crateriforme]|uniref:Signal peptidase complex subunit 1 n=1 Tax=Acrodontium crateriforme TaxID=150365 RepID=A0AAQ3M4K9_9PEZI|nr:Hypothetical protein R9X50_00360000 [Acrodontium crateriforme]
MDQVLEKARDIWEGEIDFEGQRVAEYASTALLILVGVIAFFAGFFTDNIYNTLYTGLAGTALTFVITIPPWPVYNRHTPSWLPAKTGSGAYQGVQIQVDGQQVS